MARLILLMLLAIVVLPAVVQAEPMVTPMIREGNTGDAYVSFDSVTIGYSFTTNETLTVVSLGARSPWGMTDVRLYDAIGDLLASETVLESDRSYTPPPNTGISKGEDPARVTFYFHDLDSPITLAANQTYYLVSDARWFYVPPWSRTDPRITLLAGAPPGADAFGFGPNFEARAVPEPSTLALLMVAGAAGLLGGCIRRAVRRAGPSLV